MDVLHNPKRGVNRRDLLRGMAAAGLALTAGSPGAVAAPAGDNRITKENAKPGTRDWMLKRMRESEVNNESRENEKSY